MNIEFVGTRDFGFGRVAEFLNEDMSLFRLNQPSLEIRIKNLESIGKDVSQEKIALTEIRKGLK